MSLNSLCWFIHAFRKYISKLLGELLTFWALLSPSRKPSRSLHFPFVRSATRLFFLLPSGTTDLFGDVSFTLKVQPFSQKPSWRLDSVLWEGLRRGTTREAVTAWIGYTREGPTRHPQGFLGISCIYFRVIHVQRFFRIGDSFLGRKTDLEFTLSSYSSFFGQQMEGRFRKKCFGFIHDMNDIGQISYQLLGFEYTRRKRERERAWIGKWRQISRESRC